MPTLKKYSFLLAAFFIWLDAFNQSITSITSTTHDLVNNEVTSVVRDNKGFIWFGTRGGLQRFDGHQMRLLRNDLQLGINLLSQSIEVMLPGSQNDIWIGTKSGGLSQYFLNSGKLVNHKLVTSTNNEFNSDYILSLLEIEDQLLIGTWQGFGSLNKKSGQFKILNQRWKTFDIQRDGKDGYWLATNNGLRHLTNKYFNDSTYFFGVPGINITNIVEDPRTGYLWLGTWDQGLIRFEPATGKYKVYQSIKGKEQSLTSNNTYRLLLDSKGSLWVGTWGGGLNRFNTVTEQFEHIPLIIPGLYTTDNRVVLTLMEDPSGLIWIGTDGSGVFKYDLQQKRFYSIGNQNQILLKGSTHAIAVYVDPFKKLWVSTRGGGIQYTKELTKFNTLPIVGMQKKLEPVELLGRSFMQDKNYLWIGTNIGLARVKNLSSSVGDIEFYLPNHKDLNALKGRKINVIAKDSNGVIWIGTQEDGLSRVKGYDKNGKPLFKNYLPAYGKNGALQNERISSLLVDSKGRLWVGTYKGLHLYLPETDQFQAYFSDGTSATISNNTILCLAEDKSGHIWVGTQSGLSRIVKVENNTLEIQSFSRSEFFPNDYIHAVIPDSRSNVWLSTNKGIIRFNPQIKSVSVFDKRDGTQSVVYSENASCKDSQGNFYFGGLEGVTYFNPDSISIRQFQPDVYFTDIKINNESLVISNDSTSKQVINDLKVIELNHKQNILSLEFSALDFHAPDKNQYMYKLVGFHKDWVNAGNNRLVSFTNLKPGPYEFLVKATNSDKVWNPKEYRLEIHVLPPPWKTWWAYSLYIILFLFLLWLTRYLGLRQEVLKTQLKISNLARQQEHDLSEFKERLFTNISHEFRTPLTLILGPLEDLLQRRSLDHSLEKSMRLIQKQSKRMLRMVNQLLDFQKAESGSLQLSIQPGEIVSFCYDIFLLFIDEAKRRNIRYSYEIDTKYISFSFDFNKLEIVVFNILSNAFKYSNDGGSIVMSVKKREDGFCVIEVRDNGSGIDPQEIDKIFDRFYRGKKSDATTISGTGIGLSFVKELTELHGGKIHVESDGVSGSTFTVILPPKQEDQLFQNGEQLQLNTATFISQINTIDMSNESEEISQEHELPIILLVEDEPDMLQYIYEILSPSYQIITAVNGKVGIEKALEFIPDLIVSDIMMPQVDGIELCRTVKSDKRTSHVPVILLTALTDVNHHVQGIREGADVYLPKPFNSQLLLVHIHNLIHTRNTLKDLYARKVFLGSGNFEIQSFEEEFLDKLMKLVEENIANNEFNNDELANLMFMSRSTFYRKLKAVTGMSGNEFIRTARLNYAAKLLESGKYSVSEAAFESGFNDIKYFRKRFQDQFGVSPSDYKKH